MINIMYAVDPIKRIVKPMSGHAVTEQDHEASSLRFAFPDNIAGTGLDSTGTAVRVMYIRPDGGDPVAKTLTFYRHSGGYYLYDWNLQKSDLSKEGGLTFSLCVFAVADGAVSVKWHTVPYQIRVENTIHTDDDDSPDETITPTVAERVAVLETMIQRVASGAPIVVTSTSAMTDTDKIYVLKTDRCWYYYNNAEQEWQEGGQYGGPPSGSIVTDDIADGAVTLNKLDPEIRDNFTDDSASGVSYDDTHTNLGATTVQQAIEKVVKNNVYNCTFTGNDIAGYSYATGSTYAGLYAAVSAGFPAYVKYAETTGVPDTYHLIYVNGEEMLFLCIRGQNVKTFVIDPDSVQHASVSYAQSADVTAAINALKGIYDPRNLQADVFSYASGRVDDLYDNYVSPIITDIRGAYTIHTDGGDSVYTSLGAAVNGVLTAAQA